MAKAQNQPRPTIKMYSKFQLNPSQGYKDISKKTLTEYWMTDDGHWKAYRQNDNYICLDIFQGA